MLDFNNLGFTFEEAESTIREGFEVLPIGIYTVRVKGVEDREAKSGIAGRSITFEVIDPLQYAKRIIFKNCWLESKDPTKQKIMFGMFSGFLSACGISKEAKELMFKAGYPANALMVELSEKEYVIDLSIKEYDGKFYNEVKKVISFKDAGASF